VRLRRGGRRLRGSLARVVVVSVALALVINLATSTVTVTWRWWPVVVWTGVVILLLASVSVEYARRRADIEAVDPAVLLNVASDVLARLVRRQWEQEATLRGLLRPEPLRVRWSSTGRLVAASAEEVIGPTAGARATRLKLRGDVMGVAAAWRQLPRRQLVVIGAPGQVRRRWQCCWSVGCYVIDSRRNRCQYF
jgi:hypothetical protein